MKTSQKVQLVLQHMGNNPYQLAQATGVPVKLINNLLWHNLAAGDITLAQAERLADYWDQLTSAATRPAAK
ncbi:hypothetical protein [Levilactobacillus zymae]|jgi:hypothetical protein|nr:hypothetical protein [Levilactobacillus zymae]KRL16604.1 hypothetical protein FD38_GL000034 [Levilactobacillus zymae DSM 19395]MDT6980720.1 hypothetical protein [Levilactobacillus zymae]QFR60596.1 hypothetical protein LZ395_03235 [Levilactobacillus zymae]SMS14374.1 hypothetical protein LZ3411_1324 [Levilactobacillus zymae]